MGMICWENKTNSALEAVILPMVSMGSAMISDQD